MHLSLSQAAKETGKSKATISKYIKNGSLSIVEKTEKGYKLDPAEVFRVFPIEGVKNGESEQTQTPHLNPHIPPETALLREMLERERETVEDLRQRLDKAEEAREALTLRLEHIPKRKKFLGLF